MELRTYLIYSEDPNFYFAESAKIILGISYLMENRYEDTNTWLQSVSPESTFVQDAEWRLALT